MFDAPRCSCLTSVRLCRHGLTMSIERAGREGWGQGLSSRSYLVSCSGPLLGPTPPPLFMVFAVSLAFAHHCCFPYPHDFRALIFSSSAVWVLSPSRFLRDSSFNCPFRVEGLTGAALMGTTSRMGGFGLLLVALTPLLHALISSTFFCLSPGWAILSTCTRWCL